MSKPDLNFYICIQKLRNGKPCLVSNLDLQQINRTEFGFRTSFGASYSSWELYPSITREGALTLVSKRLSKTKPKPEHTPMCKASMCGCPFVRSCVFVDLSWLETTWPLLGKTRWITKTVSEQRSWRADQERRAGQKSRYKWQSCWAQTPRQWQVQPNILLSFS